MAVVFEDAEVFPADDVEVDVVREFVAYFVIDAPQLGAAGASIGSGEVEQGGFVLFDKLSGGYDGVAKQDYLEFRRAIADLIADFHGGGRLRLGGCRGLSGLRRLRWGLLHRDGLGRGSGLSGWRYGGLRGGIGGLRRLCLGLLHRDGLGRGGRLRRLRCGGLWRGISGLRWLRLRLLHYDGLGHGDGLRGLGCCRLRRWFGRRFCLCLGLLHRGGLWRSGGLRLARDGRGLSGLRRLRL